MKIKMMIISLFCLRALVIGMAPDSSQAKNPFLDAESEIQDAFRADFNAAVAKTDIHEIASLINRGYVTWEGDLEKVQERWTEKMSKLASFKQKAAMDNDFKAVDTFLNYWKVVALILIESKG